MDLISIIIPTYNRAELLKRSIESVLDQTYSNIEIIIVDDCSSDNTINVLKEIKDPRVKYYINSKNMGACFSRNRGVDYSTGKYIAFQDSDDIWKKDKIERSVKCLIDQNVDIVFCSLEKIDKNYKRVLPNENFNLIQDKLEAVLMKSYASTQTIFGKRECFTNERFDENMPKLQDKDLMIRLVQKYNVYHLNEVLVISYIQNDSITNNKKDFEANSRIFEKYYDIIKERDKVLITYYYRLGSSLENKKSNGKEYFKQAFIIKKSFKISSAYFLSMLRLYRYKMYLKKVVKFWVTKFKLWKYIQ